MKRTTLVLMAMFCGTPVLAESLVPQPEAEGRVAVPAETRLRLGDFQVEIETGVGRKTMSRGWKRLSEQQSVSSSVTVGWKRAGNLGLAIDAVASRARKAGPQYAIAGATSELGIGLRYRTSGGPMKGVVGAGAAWMQSEMAHAMPAWKTIRRAEEGAGLWGSFGIRFEAGRYAEVGVDARYSSDAMFGAGRTLSAAGVSLGATVGLRLGGVN